MDIRLGGCGGVYFYAPKGALWAEVQRQDLNIRNNKTHLRALLLSPDRRVVDQAWIGEDGEGAGSGPGPTQRRILRTDVERPGVYGLNITVTQDRYGENISWGFRTNCRKYLIETSRGHRDARHTEPIVLRNADVPGNVGFMPRTGPFTIDVRGLAKDVKELAGRSQKPPTPQYRGLADALGQMGLDVSHKRVVEAVESLYPEGLTEGRVDGTTLRNLFQYLEGNR